MSNVLITGISGFVGGHLAKHLKRLNQDNIIGIIRDQIPSVWLDEVLDDVVLVQGDIRNYDMVSRTINHYDIDQIYHIAAFANVKQAHKFPIHVYESNIMGTVNVLEAVRKVGGECKVLVFNTDKVYGEKLNANEDDRLEVSEPYSASKICQELVALSYIKTYGMNIKISRSCNIFGYDPWNSRLISNVTKDCIRGNNPIIFKNDSSIREYVFIEDVLDAVTRIMNKEEEYHIYNIRTGYIYNQEDIILKILENFPKLEMEYKDVDIPYQVQEETMNSIHWDWKPKWSFEDGLKKTIDLFYEYQDDWKRW